MADPHRTPPHLIEVLDLLEQQPHAFDFFQAVRLLDCAESEKPPTGYSSRLADDTVRFGQDSSMGFAPATLAKVEPQKAGRPRRVLQRFFGLLGPNGPLPLHLTEYARDRVRDRGDHTFRSFLDVFNHRLTSLFYRAWARVRPPVSFDKPSSDRFSDYVGSLLGLGMPSLRDRDALPDLPKRHFAGLLSCQTKHAEGLLALLNGYFCFPVAVEEFVGQWIELPHGSQCLTGASSSHLGVSTTVGSHVWDCQQKFRIVIGPLTLEEYYRMLPGGGADEEDPPRRESLDAMIAAVRNYVGDELDWDLQLILKKEETPPVKFGEQGRLGWTSWMPPEVMEKDPDDLVLRPMERVFARQSASP
ncbi:type VI secretion system baseplate subunit TssG [Pirellulales bacterium]|nr:type VI secretion system baseplate subunit TssG [Pirellulales bacterium]